MISLVVKGEAAQHCPKKKTQIGQWAWTLN